MSAHGRANGEIQGMFRDVLRDRDGRVVWERPWTKNAIVADCRRLLAAFLRGDPTSGDPLNWTPRPGLTGVQGMQVGAGLATWDQAAPIPANPLQASLVDPNPWPVPRSALQFDFLAGAAVSPTPTQRVQIRVTLGPNMPPWPQASTGHADSTLREFGLYALLDGQPVLLNYRTHPAIPKDPTSTLERTIWLVF